jgi:hypothetical protein
LFSPAEKNGLNHASASDFVADAGGRLEIFEAKWTELPDAGDTVNLEFVRHVIGKSRVAAGAGRLTRRYAL